MAIWLNAIGYQLLWFCAVIGAGRGLWWPALAAAAAFIGWQLAASPQRAVDLRLIAAALVCGVLLDGGLAASGLARYAAPWPAAELAEFAPLWILAIWASFAMTLTHSLRLLQSHLGAALALGAIGGPLAYWGAARGWQALTFAAPTWAGLLYLAVAWALAMPLLAWLARRWMRAQRRQREAPRSARA